MFKERLKAVLHRKKPEDKGKGKAEEGQAEPKRLSRRLSSAFGIKTPAEKASEAGPKAAINDAIAKGLAAKASATTNGSTVGQATKSGEASNEVTDIRTSGPRNAGAVPPFRLTVESYHATLDWLKQERENKVKAATLLPGPKKGPKEKQTAAQVEAIIEAKRQAMYGYIATGVQWNSSNYLEAFFKATKNFSFMSRLISYPPTLKIISLNISAEQSAKQLVKLDESDRENLMRTVCNMGLATLCAALLLCYELRTNISFLWAVVLPKAIHDDKIEVVREILEHPKCELGAREQADWRRVDFKTAVLAAGRPGKTEMLKWLLYHPKINVKEKPVLWKALVNKEPGNIELLLKTAGPVR